MLEEKGVGGDEYMIDVRYDIPNVICIMAIIFVSHEPFSFLTCCSIFGRDETNSRHVYILLTFVIHKSLSA